MTDNKYMTTNRDSYEYATHAYELIQTIKSTLDNDNDAHDLKSAARTILIELATFDLDADLNHLINQCDIERPSTKLDLELIRLAAALRELYNFITTIQTSYNNTTREYFTELALSQSLCPIHFIDYAICFDDDEPSCALIRTIHPAHDS